MPSKSSAQARLMAAVAHDPAFAKRVGIPQSVGQDFNQADKGTGIIRPKKRGLRFGRKTVVPSVDDALGNQTLRIGSKRYGGK